jgi:hypothetical protein
MKKITLGSMRPSGLGEFPETSLSETELFEKFAVPHAEIFVQGHYLPLRDIQTFSGVNLDLSGTEPAGRAQCDIFIQIMTTLIIRSLDFLLLFGQAKSRREIEICRISFFNVIIASYATCVGRGDLE